MRSLQTQPLCTQLRCALVENNMYYKFRFGLGIIKAYLVWCQVQITLNSKIKKKKNDNFIFGNHPNVYL